VLTVAVSDNMAASNSEGGLAIIGGEDNFMAPDCLPGLEGRDATHNQVHFTGRGLRLLTGITRRG
jgi:hypothetical protein